MTKIDAYELGDLVLAHAYGGEALVRRVVKDLGKTVVICDEDEYQRHRWEKDSQINGVGFPREDIEPYFNTGVSLQ